MKKTLLSLYDYTGNWCRPYREAGWNVIQIDIKHGIDIFDWEYDHLKNVYGILAAIPCTDYALSGAKHFEQKDKDGRTAFSQLLVKKTKEIIRFFNPNFWVIENPKSRIHKLNPWMGQRPKFIFNPCDFAKFDPQPQASRYNKETWLFGKFNDPFPPQWLEPTQKEFPGFSKLGGKSEKTKEMRSITPLGFAYAFYAANH